jgi:hypothetical protein
MHALFRDRILSLHGSEAVAIAQHLLSLSHSLGMLAASLRSHQLSPASVVAKEAAAKMARSEIRARDVAEFSEALEGAVVIIRSHEQSGAQADSSELRETLTQIQSIGLRFR